MGIYLSRLTCAITLLAMFYSPGCNRSPAAPSFTWRVDINDDGVVDPADEAARVAGRAELMRWYEPVLESDRKTPQPHFERAEYAQPVRLELAKGVRAGVITATVSPADGIAFFADAACTTPTTPEWKLAPRQSREIVFYLLALPRNSKPQKTQGAVLTVELRDDAASAPGYAATLNLTISGSLIPNPQYFPAARDALVEAGEKGLNPHVYEDMILRDTDEPFHVAILRARDVRLQVFDATGLASDPVNAWRPNPGVRAENIEQAVKAHPGAVAVINGNYFHEGPWAEGTHIGLYPEGPLMEAGREWTADPKRWGDWWGSWIGVFAQLDDGAFWYKAGATGWPPHARSGVAMIKTANWDAAPHSVIGVAKVGGADGNQEEELIFLACGDLESGHGRWASTLNCNLGALRRSLGLVFFGALDGGGSNALAAQTPGGVLQVVPGSGGNAGRHCPGSMSCINNYLVFHPAAKVEQ